jgi:ribosomal protein L40E
LKRVAGVAWNTCSGCLQSFSALDYDVKHRDDVQTVDWCPSCVEWTSCPKCATACVSARQLVVHLTAIDCQLFTASSLTNLSDLLSLVPDLTSSPSTSTSVSSSSSLLSLSLSTSIPSEDPSISSLSLSTSAPYPRSSFSYSSSSSSSSFSTSSLSLSSSSSIPSLLDALRTPRLLEPTSMSAHDTLNTTNVLPSNANVLPSNTTASSSTAVLARDKLFEENVRKSRASYEQGLLQQYELEVPHELRTAAAFDDFRRRVHAHRRPQVGREKGVTQMTRRGGGGGGGSGGGGGGDTIENDTGMNGPRIRQDNLHGNASLNTCMKRKSPMHFALSGSALNGQRDTAGELADTGEYNRVTGGTRGKRDVGGMSSLTSSQPRRPFKNLSLGDHFGQDKASSSSSSSSAFNPGRVTSHTRRDDVKRDDDDGDDDDNVWNCDRCTLVNRSSSRECGACGTLNPRQQRRRCTISPTDDELKWGGPVRYGSGGTDLGKRSGPPRGRDARGIVDPAGGIGHGSGGGGDGRDSGGYGGESKGNGVRNWLEEGEVDEWGCDHCGADNSRHFDSCRRCEHKNRRLLYRESPPPLYAYSPLSPKEAIASPPPPHHSLPDYSHTSSSSSSSSLSHNTGVFSATPSRSTTSLPPSTLPPLQLLPPYSSYPSSSTYLSSFSGTAMPKPQWACRQCTLENDGRDHNCIACNLPRSSP